MPLASGIQETSTTTGTGTLTLVQSAGFARFSDAFAGGDLVPYSIRSGQDFEIGLGTYLATNQLARTTVIATLVAGVYDASSPAALNLPAGTKTVRHADIGNLAAYLPSITTPVQDDDRLLITRGAATFSVAVSDLRGAPQDAIVLLMAGQSNMDGRGEEYQLPAVLQGPQSNARIWFSNAWQVMEAGVNTKFSDPVIGECGPEMQLAARVATQYAARVPIYIVKYAQDATGIDPAAESSARDQVWSPSVSGQLYDRFVGDVLAALTNLLGQGLNVYVRGMFWMQGENDSILQGSADNYETNLTGLIAALRTDLNLPALPFILGRIHDNLPTGSYPTTRVNTVRAAMAAVAAADSNVYLIDTDAYPLLGDSIHYTTSGLNALGDDYADVVAGFGGLGIAWTPPASGGVNGAVSISDIQAGQAFSISVIDNDLNTNTGSAQTVQVTVVNDITSESETVTLTETGVNTGVFSGTLNTSDTAGAGTNNDASMNVQSGQTVTVTYVDALIAGGGGPVNRTDQATVSAASSGVNGSVTISDIQAGQAFALTVTDNDLNTNTGSTQTVQVTVVNDITSESETVTLTETGANTGIFSGSLATSDTAGAGTNNDASMNVQAGQTVTVTYVDAVIAGGGGPVNRTDQATVSAASGGYDFEDDFVRADDAAVGNGWLEKRASAWDLNTNAARKLSGGDYLNNLVYRPSGENLADVEVSVEFRVSAIPPGYLMALVRVVPGTPEDFQFAGYGLYIDNSSTQVLLGRQVGAPFITTLATLTLSSALNTSDLYRFRLRAVGNTPVALSAWVERWTGSAWAELATATYNDSAGNQITAAGSIGWTGHTETTYRVSRFTRSDV